MRTRLCQKLGIEVPIIQAPMGGASCPALAAAVSNAGGLGMLALSWSDPEALRRQIRETRSRTDKPFGINLVLEWDQADRLASCLEEGVRIISLFWGDPTSLISRIHDAGALALQTVASAAEARRAVDAGVDIVVAQGWEAGGHVWGQVATTALLPAVVDAISPTPVVAAGGIADGRGIAAALSLGAAGVWMGTRFLAAKEANIHPDYRERIIQAAETDTQYGALFDLGWPNAPHRTLRNSTVASWQAAGSPSSGQRPNEGEVIGRSPIRGEFTRYRSATPTPDIEGNIEAFSMWAGQGVGLVKKVEPAADIMHTLIEETRHANRQTSQLLG